jgi:hypothetical protein
MALNEAWVPDLLFPVAYVLVSWHDDAKSSKQSAGLPMGPHSVSQWPLAQLVQPPGPLTHLHH